MTRIITALALAAALLLPSPAMAQKAAPAHAYVVKGFRTAEFGNTSEQVLAAIGHDFAVKPADVKRLPNAAEGTTALTVTLDKLAPGPGPCTVTYILGKNGRLIHVNVVWFLASNVTPQDRINIVQAGVKLSDYFREYGWASGITDMPTGPNSVAVFLGQDAAGGGVEVRADGVTYRHAVNGKMTNSPIPSGPASLKIAYASRDEANQVTTIKKGDY